MATKANEAVLETNLSRVNKTDHKMLFEGMINFEQDAQISWKMIYRKLIMMYNTRISKLKIKFKQYKLLS